MKSTERYQRSLGQIVSLVGLKGMMKVYPTSNNPSLFLNVKNILLTDIRPGRAMQTGRTMQQSAQNSATPASATKTIEAIVKHISLVKECFHIQLEQYDSRTEVEPLVGANLYVDENDLKALAKDEWWVRDLIGLTVYTTNGKLIGTVCSAPGEHGEFLEIRKANSDTGETVVVSFVKQLFPVVDLKSKRIEVEDLPGLFDL